ncbi:hypothetical protein BRD18_06285 [Halobacteriales archaeon SW_7_71_33]|nr:MAG: hypothetical protein BRD18_06285 [Halobacteriales archaeon SW_7_71_33]
MCGGERSARRLYYGLRALNYDVGAATPKRSVAGTHWSYEPVDTHTDDVGLAALAALPRDATVIDVGAHVGEYAVPLALGGRRVHAVEPNPVAVGRLERNRRRNGVDLAVHPIGLGERRDERPFYRSTYPKLSSFDRAAATRWGARVADVRRVAVRPLDELVGAADGEASNVAVSPPDAVKVDAEGVELAVLRGGRGTVETHRPLLVVEHHGDAGDEGEDGGETLRS